uniref:Uncharacterized protein n=1 Tax=mine drainage metagenome TaxID=410659 RepID=E6PF99_9ZZZZ
MLYRHASRLLLAVALSLLCAVTALRSVASAKSTPARRVVATRSVDFSGLGHAPWLVRVTTEALGRDASRTFEQWRIEVDRPKTLGGGIAYQTPGTDMLLDRVEKANGANLWFPNQEAQLLGAGRFLPGVRRQLLVRIYQSGADCGSATIALLGLRGKGSSIGRLVSVENACSLDVQIARSARGDELILSGPYYAANAALCCPTKLHAEARLLYRGGHWIERPQLFKLVLPTVQ